MVNFFVFLKLYYCFVVAMSDLAPDVEAIYHFPQLVIASEYLFRSTIDVRETAIFSFMGITLISSPEPKAHW